MNLLKYVYIAKDMNPSFFPQILVKHQNKLNSLDLVINQSRRVANLKPKLKGGVSKAVCHYLQHYSGTFNKGTCAKVFVLLTFSWQCQWYGEYKLAAWTTVSLTYNFLQTCVITKARIMFLCWPVCRIQGLFLCREVSPPTSVLDMTVNNLKVRF